MVNNKSYTLSIFAKAGTNRNYLIFFTNLTADREMTFFDLANGVVANADERHIARIEGVGNDWYRCSITYTPDSSETGFSTAWNVYFGDNDSSRTVTDNDGFIYVWGAQLEQRDSVTTYTSTMRDDGTSAPITKYQPKLMTASPDSARFDHDPITAESKGLLIEEQRTNLISYSEDFSSGAWVTDDASIKTDCVIAPDGTLTADKLVENTNTAQHLVAQLFNFQSGTSYTFSIFAKKGESESMFFNITNLANVLGGQPVYAKADLSDGNIQLLSGNDATVGSEDVGNGWFRFTISGTCTVTASAWLGVRTYDSTGSTTNYLGDGYSGLYIWGAQLETGSFATSYIKTTGASATRSADNASITGENFSSWYRQDEGSIYCEAANGGGTSGVVPVSFDGGTSDYIFLNLRSAESFEIKKNNVYQVSSLGFSGVAAETYHKIMGAYKKDSAAVSINGLSSLTDSTCEIPTVNRLIIGTFSGIAQNVHVKKLAYYPQRLTNEQLQNLTK